MNKKRLLNILLIVAMVMTSFTFAFADTDQHTITILNEKEGHTYEAYQIFTGNLANGKLVDIEWGNGIKVGEDLLADLVKIDSFKDCKDVEDVAEVVATFGDDSVALDEFAEVVGKHLSPMKAISADAVAAANDMYAYEINVVGDGYYMIKDADGSQDNVQDAYTKYIMNIVKVVDDLTITAKDDYPDIDKKIDGDTDTDENTEGLVEYNNAAIGDKVPYVITSSVPDMDGYAEYKYLVADVMSKGLTFNNDITVEINRLTDEEGLGSAERITLEEGVHYTVNTMSGGNETVIYIDFIDFLQWKDYKDWNVVLTYSATVNEKAEIGVVGNPNKVLLQYSNNPNAEPGAEPEGITPEHITRTYVTYLELLKVDGADQTALTGAEFKIEGTKLTKMLVTEGVFKENADGEYWLLKDGTYTKVGPGTADDEVNDDAYASTTKKYALVTETRTETVPETISAVATVNAEGKIVFTGLASGTYKITEIKAPAGYNLLKEPIEVEINWAPPAEGKTECTWTYIGTDKVIVDGNEVGIAKVTIENNQGTTLPSTGGIGTTIFYVLGSVLVIGAAVLLISKKRMEN